MADDRYEIGTGPRTRVWLSTEEPVERLLSHVNPAWPAQLTDLSTNTPYLVATLELIDHPEAPLILLGIDVEADDEYSETELADFGQLVAQTVWPYEAIEFRPHGPLGVVTPPQPVLRCCGGIGSHLASCPLTQSKGTDR